VAWAVVPDEDGERNRSPLARGRQHPEKTYFVRGIEMASDVNELTINYSEDGVQIVKELDKEILTKGAWSTVLFRFKEWNRQKEVYGPDKYTIRRYQKRNNEYWQKSKFNISSRDQARKLIEVLQRWVDEPEEE
jgi:hypothetical protein